MNKVYWLICVSACMNAFQEKGLPVDWSLSGLLSFAHMNVLAFSFRSHRSQGDTDRDVALTVQNVCIHSLSFRCCSSLP